MAVFDDMKGISVASGFKLQAESPLDKRMQVETYDELQELVDGNGAWEGMMVYVKSESATFRYTSDNDGGDWNIVLVGDQDDPLAAIADGGITTAKLADSAVTTAKLDSAVSGQLNYFGICETARDVTDKVVTASNCDVDEYFDGMRVTVRFVNGLQTQLRTTGVSSATLDVNGLGAATIVYDGADALTGFDADRYFTDNHGILSFVYDAEFENWVVDAPTLVYNAETAAYVEDDGVSTAAIQDGAVTLAKLNDDVAENIDSKLESLVVSALPSTSVTYDFEDGASKFVNHYRTACSVVADEDNGGYCQKIATSGNSNTYRSATFDCSDTMTGASSMTVEFDASLSGRWQLSLADLSQRPGESSGTTYTAAGCAFSIGTLDGSTLKVYGADGTVTLSGWKHIKAVLDFTAKTVTYTISDRSAGTVLKTGTIDFRDTTVTEITGFEAYIWAVTTDLLIDNIEITALFDAKENLRYLVPNDNGYDEYEYIDGEPVKLSGVNTVTTDDIADGAVTAAKLATSAYSETPVQVGTWIDGTPVWRQAFQHTFTDDEKTAISTDKNSVISNYISVSNTSSAFIVNGRLALMAETPCSTDDTNVSWDANLIVLSDDQASLISSATYDGIWGWFEFATAESNISS